MGLPGRRHNKSRSRKRRSHHALARKNLAACPKCAQPVLSHRVCTSCGTYKGRVVVTVKERASRRAKEARAGKR